MVWLAETKSQWVCAGFATVSTMRLFCGNLVAQETLDKLKIFTILCDLLLVVLHLLLYEKMYNLRIVIKFDLI